MRAVDSDGITELRFTTDDSVRYALTFAPNTNELRNTSFAANCLTIAIVPMGGYHYAGPFSGLSDPKIKATIMGQLVELFQSNRYLVLNYSCDLDSDLERHRSIVFGSWYKEYLEPIGVLRKQHDNPGDRQYAGVFYWGDHPDKEEIERVFSAIFLGK